MNEIVFYLSICISRGEMKKNAEIQKSKKLEKGKGRDHILFSIAQN